MKKSFLLLCCILFGLGQRAMAEHARHADDNDLNMYLDFAWDAYIDGRESTNNPHDFVLGTNVWQEYVDFLLDEYIFISGQIPDEDWDDLYIYDDVGWLDFEEFAWWLDWFVPHIADDVMLTVAWRDWASTWPHGIRHGVSSGNSAIEVGAENQFPKIDPRLTPSDFGINLPNPDISSAEILSKRNDAPSGRYSDYGSHLCHDLPGDLILGFPDSNEFGGFQELIYVLWWQQGGCLHPEHWKSYLTFRKAVRESNSYLKDDNGAWNHPLSMYDLFMGMFDRGNYNFVPPTVGDLIEFEIFIGWIEFQEAAIPMFHNFEGKIDGHEVSFTYPVPMRKGIKGKTVGQRLLYLMTVEKSVKVPDALMGLLLIPHEAPIEHFEAFKAWLGHGVDPLTKLELLQAGGINTSTDLANYLDLKLQQFTETHAPNSIVLAGVAGGFEGFNNVLFRAPDQLVNNVRSFGDATGEAIYGMEDRPLLDRLAVASRDVGTLSEVTLILALSRTAVKARSGSHSSSNMHTSGHVGPRGPPKVHSGTASKPNSSSNSRTQAYREHSENPITKSTNHNSYSHSLNSEASGQFKFKRWKRGEPIDKPMPDGSNPSWNVVRSRYWKNRYEAAKATNEFSTENLFRMKRGSAPQDFNPRTGKFESRELHHVVPRRSNGSNNPFNLRELTPDQHRAIDSFRH